MGQPTWDIEITVDQKALDAKLDILEARLGDTELSVWMKADLVGFLRVRANSRFANEGDDAVGAWAPLSSVTQYIRASQGFSPSHPINVRSGDLKSYIVGDSGVISASGGGVQVEYPSPPPTQKLRTKLETAQTGKQSPSTVMRPVVALGLTDYNEIMDLLSIYITNGLV